MRDNREILHSFLQRFISVSNALPKTSYVKMIDIWLLFNLTIPFAEVTKYFVKILLAF